MCVRRRNLLNNYSKINIFVKLKARLWHNKLISMHFCNEKLDVVISSGSSYFIKSVLFLWAKIIGLEYYEYLFLLLLTQLDQYGKAPSPPAQARAEPRFEFESQCLLLRRIIDHRNIVGQRFVPNGSWPTFWSFSESTPSTANITLLLIIWFSSWHFGVLFVFCRLTVLEHEFLTGKHRFFWNFLYLFSGCR